MRPTIEQYEAAVERMRQVEGGEVTEKDYPGWADSGHSAPPYRYAALEVRCVTADAPRWAHDLAVLAIEISGCMDMGSYTDGKHRWLRVRLDRDLTPEETLAAGERKWVNP